MVIIKLYGGYDIDKLKCIGKGIHGRVYRVDSKSCIKIFKKMEFYEKELETLRMVQRDAHFPKLFDWGDKFIVREYIGGIELDKYLKRNPLTTDVSLKIIDLYDGIVKAGFSRHDTMLFHIFITQDVELKMIDTARVMKEAYSCPKLLLKGLNDLGCRDEFLKHVKLLRPELYEKWGYKS